MTLKLINVGNSKGIRIPKEYLHGYAEDEQFELIREGDKLILYPINKKKHEWARQLTQEKPATNDSFILNDFDGNDWEWN